MFVGASPAEVIAMRRWLCVLLLLGLVGCSKEQEAVKIEKPRSKRQLPIDIPKKLKAKSEETPKTPEGPARPKPYTYGDLVTALQDDAKAREYQSRGGRLDARDPRLFVPDARHTRIQNILADRYNSRDITLANVLKLREELCKANDVSAEQINAIPLEEIADLFEKSK
jgi:hypothetical protein